MKPKSLAEFFQQKDKKNRPRYRQSHVANQLGISAAYMSMLVSGERQPGLRLALRIEDVTGIPVRALVEEEVA